MMQSHSVWVSFLSTGVSTRGTALGISVPGGLCKIIVRQGAPVDLEELSIFISRDKM